MLGVVAVAFLVAAAAEYLGKRGFLTLSGRIGQAVLLDLRQRVYGHFQRLSIGFHERYTSGRMVARLTSDMDTIAELVDGGIDGSGAGRAVGRLDRRHAADASTLRWPR